MDNLNSFKELYTTNNAVKLLAKHRNGGTPVIIEPSLIVKVFLGSVLVVSPTYSTGNGVRGSITHKYKTIASAEADAQSGDVIIVTEMVNNEANLGKDGITYHFLPGTGVNNTTVTGRIFNDNGKTNSGANPLFFKITGHGDFTSRTEYSAIWGGTLYLYEGSSAEFEFRSSTILNLDGSKADSGYHFWAQAEYINGAGAGKLATLKGRVERNCIGGHFFIGAHSAIANIDVGGSVDISAIFVSAQGCEYVDINVDQKVTVGYSTTHTFKFFLNVDRVPFFTGNIDTIEGTNTINISAKMVEWQNDGADQNSIWGIFKIYEYNDNTNTHTRNYVNIDIDEFLVKAGTQTVQRPFIVSSNMGNDTETVVKFNNSKITIEDGFPFASIASSSQKNKYNIIFKDCSIDYKHDSLGASAVLMDIRYVMFHIINSRFKVSAQGVSDGYILLDDSTNTDKNVQIDNVVTNAVIPTALLNYGTAISSNSTGIRSGVTDIRIV